MSRLKRILLFINGMIQILFGLIFLTAGNDGYKTVLFIMEVSLIAYGIRQLIYYLTMARFMVGGIYILYKGILILDAGLFAANLDNVPRQYAMLYLIGGMALSGLIAVLRAVESRRIQSARWKYPLFYGSVEIVTSLLCLFFLNSPRILITVYSIGVLHAGLSRVISAFRRSAIVYISV